MTTNTTSTASQEKCPDCYGTGIYEDAHSSFPCQNTFHASKAPAVSIDTPEFRGMMLAAATSWPTKAPQIAALVNHIDAHTAAAVAKAYLQGYADMKVLAEAAAKHYTERATAAEAKLEAIRKGVDGLKRYFPSVGFPGRLFEDESGIAFKCDDVLALIQQQPKADESGLPG